MASTARLFFPFQQIRFIGTDALKTPQVLVRRTRRRWTRSLLSFGFPIVGLFSYSLWSQGGDVVTIERSDKTAQKKLQGLESGDGSTSSTWKIFIRCTHPYTVVRDIRDLSATERAKAVKVKDFYQDKENWDRLYGDLLGRVNNRLARMNFLGAGPRNTVGIVMTERPVVVQFYDYKADGLELSTSGIRWSTSDVAPKIATRWNSILATPLMALYASYEVLLSQWDPPPKTQVIPPNSPKRSVGGSSRQESSNSQPSQTSPFASDTATISGNGASSPKVLTSESNSTKSKPFFSYENQVDVISSFLSQQKDVVRQSNGASGSSARRLFDNFWKEFQHERSLRTILTHSPPGGNIIINVAVMINGERKRVLLFVEADYDVTTDTWGPIFIEPMESMRSKARRRGRGG